MEESIARLRELYRYHLSLPFPDGANSDELAESIERLAELDGHVIGVVTNALDTNQFPNSFKTNNLKELRRVFNCLKCLQGDDQSIFRVANLYLNSLEQMGSLLATIV